MKDIGLLKSEKSERKREKEENDLDRGSSHREKGREKHTVRERMRKKQKDT